MPAETAYILQKYVQFNKLCQQCLILEAIQVAKRGGLFQTATVSFGLAGFEGSRAPGFNELLAQADSALTSRNDG